MLGQEIRCPLCRAAAADDGRCPDCGQDLKPLSYLQARAALLYNRALELIRAGDTERAVHHLEAALAEDETLVDAWVVLGKLRARTGRPDDARRALQAAVALDPAHEGARTALAGLGSVPPPDDRPATASRPRRRGVLFLALGAALVLAAALAVVLVQAPRSPAPAAAPAPVGFFAVTARGGSVELTGPVPDGSVRADLAAAARQGAGGRAVVVDSMLVDASSGIPSWLDPAVVGRLVSALADGSSANRTVVVSGTKLALSGMVADEASRTALVAAIGSAVPASTVDDELVVGRLPGADDEATRLDAAVSAVQSVSPIYFPAGQEYLGPRGTATVRSIGRLLVGARSVTIEVDGYDVAQISDRRVQSVRAALVAAGVDPQQVSAPGSTADIPQQTPAAGRRLVIRVLPARQ